MPHALFIDNDLPSLVLFEELCRYHQIEYSGLQNPTQLAKTFPSLASFDIVFVDLEMPNLNGYQVLGILKQHSTYVNQPIVACTVYQTQIEEARTAGFDSFIIKPLNIEKFPISFFAILNGQEVWEKEGS